MERTLLIIDDDEKLQSLVTEYFSGYGFRVESRTDGSHLDEALRDTDPDLVILDVMLPGRDGFELLGEIRSRSKVPVIMLTAKGEDADRIVGLELGADDYLPKPFNPRELLARIRAVLRRHEGESDAGEHAGDERMLSAGGLTLDTGRQVLLVGEEEVELSTTEYRLFLAFMRRADTALSRDKLMDLVWGREYTALDRSIDVHVSRLRSKLAKFPEHENRIKTVWGTGYLFVGAH